MSQEELNALVERIMNLFATTKPESEDLRIMIQGALKKEKTPCESQQL